MRSTSNASRNRFPRFPVGSISQFAEYASRVRGYAEDAGRDPSEIGFAYSAGWYNDQEAQTLPNGDRRVFTGTPEQIAGDIKGFEELGVKDLMIGLQSDTLEGTLERMERFATRVKPLT